jgi:hypothetical protein
VGERDLGRISNKFSTIYVSGCLAFRFKILPFTEAEILKALLTCHRNHVAFIDQELGVTPLRSIAAQGAPQALVKAIPADAFRAAEEGRQRQHPQAPFYRRERA